MDFLVFVASMAILIYGADFIIKQSAKIALHFNISQFVIGASLIAFGTSLPEMAASVSASYKGSSEIAISNVVGSNIFNITLVLGIVFLFAKSTLDPKRDLFSRDSAWMIIPLFLLLLMILDGDISRFEGAILISLMIAYLLFLATDSKELLEDLDEFEDDKGDFNWGKTSLLLIVGFAMVIFGADFAINSASNIAREFGISEWIIGMFLIAIGTSLPELVVSISALKSGNSGMSIGNIIGSNVANITMVLGAASLIAPISIDIYKNSFDLVALLVATLMFVFVTANRLYNRSAGIAFIALLLVVVHNTLVGVI